MGLRDVPEAFDREVRNIFARVGQENEVDPSQRIRVSKDPEMSVFVYIDDLILRSRFEPKMTEEEMQNEHCNHLKKVILKAQKHGVKFNHKTRWFARETEFLGRRVTRTGIQPTEKSLDRVRHIRPPKSVKEVRIKS